MRRIVRGIITLWRRFTLNVKDCTTSQNLDGAPVFDMMRAVAQMAENGPRRLRWDPNELRKRGCKFTLNLMRTWEAMHNLKHFEYVKVRTIAMGAIGDPSEVEFELTDKGRKWLEADHE